MQRVERNGHWGYPGPGIASVQDVPGDQGGVVNVAWSASRLDAWPDLLVDEYTVWRAISASSATAAIAAGAVAVPDGEPLLRRSDSGTIRVQQAGATTYYWELVSTSDAFGLPAYAKAAPTLFDSTSVSQEVHYFQVLAHDSTEYWASPPDSGYSVDNLAPTPSALLIVQRVGSDVHLVWQKNLAADLGQYAVYRADAPGVPPTQPFFLASTEDTTLIDAGAPTSPLYYVVAAIDSHENQSEASNELGVAGGATGIREMPSLASLSLSPNQPNPFGTTTQFVIGLPHASSVEAEVYDLSGRRVRDISLGEMGAGWQRVVFDGRNSEGQPLPSGVYFYRVHAAGKTMTRKMVVAR
jgi:hypothetical protein